MRCAVIGSNDGVQCCVFHPIVHRRLVVSWMAGLNAVSRGGGTSLPSANGSPNATVEGQAYSRHRDYCIYIIEFLKMFMFNLLAMTRSYDTPLPFNQIHVATELFS